MSESPWQQAFGENELVVIGMVHLGALPGAPDWGGDMDAVIADALTDARLLEQLGADALMVENLHDGPFLRDRTGPETVAAMAVATREVVRAASVPVGAQILRNDALGSISVAAAAGGRFVRINVYTDAMVTDQGLIQGVAAEAARLRATLRSDTMFLTDLYTKHAAPVAARPAGIVAQDATGRGRSTALVLSGDDSGIPPTLEHVREVAAAVPGVPLIVGSGTPVATLPLLPLVQGVIIPSPRTYGTRCWSDDADDARSSEDAARAWMASARAAVG